MGHKPLYRQIADRIREQIARGELKPGDALPIGTHSAHNFTIENKCIGRYHNKPLS